MGGGGLQIRLIILCNVIARQRTTPFHAAIWDGVIIKMKINAVIIRVCFIMLLELLFLLFDTRHVSSGRARTDTNWAAEHNTRLLCISQHNQNKIYKSHQITCHLCEMWNSSPARCIISSSTKCFCLNQQANPLGYAKCLFPEWKLHKSLTRKALGWKTDRLMCSSLRKLNSFQCFRSVKWIFGTKRAGLWKLFAVYQRVTSCCTGFPSECGVFFESGQAGMCWGRERDRWMIAAISTLTYDPAI